MKNIQVEGEQKQVLNPITAQFFHTQQSSVEWKIRLGIFSESCILVCMPVLINYFEVKSVEDECKLLDTCSAAERAGSQGDRLPSWVVVFCHAPEMMSMQFSFAFIFVHDTECFHSKEDFIYSSHSLTRRFQLPNGSFSKLCIMKQDKASVEAVFPKWIHTCQWLYMNLNMDVWTVHHYYSWELNECLQPENQIIHNIFYDMEAVLCVFYYSHFDGNVNVTFPDVYPVYYIYTHTYVCLTTYLLISCVHVVFLCQCLTANCSGFPPVFI